ncbi:hypothetical protein D9M71_679150 [compost metagenome]
MHVLPEAFRRIADRVDADGVEEHLLAEPVAEELLHLAQTRRLQRAGIAAAGEDEIDQHHLALDQVVEEPDLPAVLVDQRHVGEVFAVPAARGFRLAGGLLAGLPSLPAADRDAQHDCQAERGVNHPTDFDHCCRSLWIAP